MSIIEKICTDLDKLKSMKNSRLHMAVGCGSAAFLLIVRAEGTHGPPCPCPVPQTHFNPPRAVSPCCRSPTPHSRQTEPTRGANGRLASACPHPQGGA